MVLTVVVNIFSSFVYSREYLIIGCHNQLKREGEGGREGGRERESKITG